MRLHRLTVTAFGPFARTQHVDFDELSAAGLFLLHGPTGAGKTSVLDAVCYALYGTVPGARQQPGGTLRSDHAAPGTATEVTLDLTVAGRRLEITRSPEQLRPKRRGTGTTRERARSALREYDPGSGAWHGLSRSHQEIGEEIAQLTGMSRDQFCQVVLLPQGDFARFLRSDADDRAKLLGRLFDTGRFAAAEEQLARMRRSAQEDVRAGDEALLELLHRMRQALGTGGTAAALPAPGAPMAGSRSGGAELPRPRTGGKETDDPLAAGAPGLADAVLGWAALARTTAREQRDIAVIAAATAESAHTTALAQLAKVSELARWQSRFAAAEQRARKLEARAGERAEAVDRLERARAAARVAPAVALHESAAAAHAEAQAEEARGRGRLPAELCAEPATELLRRAGACREELGSLESARRSEQRLTAVDGELRALERESRTDEEILREATEWLSGWEEARRAHQRRIDAAQEAATRAEQLAGQLEPAHLRLAAARRRDELAQQTQASDRRLLQAREAATAAHETWLDLKDRRLRGIAAELAAGLEDAKPCPVCGAVEHPDPAPPDDDAVGGPAQTPETVENAALAAYRDAERDRDEADTEARRLREAFAAADAEARGEETGALSASVAALEADHARAHAEAAEAHAAREALAHAEREHAERLAQQREAERRSAARTSQREALQRERAALSAELAQARGDAPSVAERAAVLQRRTALLTEAAEGARRAEETGRRTEEAAAQLADAAARVGFDSPSAAVSCLLDEDGLRALERRLEEWRAQEAAVEVELADPELKAAAALPAADPGAAQRAADEAVRRLRAASATEDAAATRCRELDRLSRQAADGARRLAPLREAHDRVARLAGLAAGTSAENEIRMRLESYVLAARLEQVAAAATVRLARMSAGRYTLVHSDARSGGRRRSGLGLHVIDSWTGAERDTASLSGGETFSASLALALGLADVVTDEAGGTRLETLFIDEGFGSLDEQTLDEILDVLDSLRERDRCVGIVSHVPDLRQRIPTQLEIVKSRHGSTLRHRSAPAQM